MQGIPARVLDDCRFHRIRLQGLWVMGPRHRDRRTSTLSLTELGRGDLVREVHVPVQPVWVKLVKNVFGRWKSSRRISPPRPEATATRIWVTQSGWAGHPGMLMTGRPARDRNDEPRNPPGVRFKNWRPVD